MESSDSLQCNPRALREGYMEALQRFLDSIRRTCASYRIDYELIRTSRHVDAALTAYLSSRMAHMRRDRIRSVQFLFQPLTWGFLLAIVPLLIHLINW